MPSSFSTMANTSRKFSRQMAKVSTVTGSTQCYSLNSMAISTKISPRFSSIQAG